MYISDEQLHAMELYIYHAINFEVEGLDGEQKYLRCVDAQKASTGMEGIDGTPRSG
jgi:hypothetical protein